MSVLISYRIIVFTECITLFPANLQCFYDPTFLSFFIQKSLQCTDIGTKQSKSRDFIARLLRYAYILIQILESQLHASHKGCTRHRVAEIDFVLLCQKVLASCPQIKVLIQLIVDLCIEEPEVLLGLVSAYCRVEVLNMLCTE